MLQLAPIYPAEPDAIERQHRNVRQFQAVSRASDGSSRPGAQLKSNRVANKNGRGPVVYAFNIQRLRQQSAAGAQVVGSADLLHFKSPIAVNPL